MIQEFYSKENLDASHSWESKGSNVKLEVACNGLESHTKGTTGTLCCFGAQKQRYAIIAMLATWFLSGIHQL